MVILSRIGKVRPDRDPPEALAPDSTCVELPGLGPPAPTAPLSALGQATAGRLIFQHRYGRIGIKVTRQLDLGLGKTEIELIPAEEDQTATPRGRIFAGP